MIIVTRLSLVFNNPDSQLAGTLGFSSPLSASPFLPANVLTNIMMSLLENKFLFCVCGVGDESPGRVCVRQALGHSYIPSLKICEILII